MQKANSWGRMVLAFAAILVVAGSGLSFAVANGAAYVRPKFAVIVGPGVVAPSSVTNYTLSVTFVDNSVATETAPTVLFSANPGSFNSAGNYSAPASTGRAVLTAKYTSAGATVTANRAIVVGSTP